jgi:hypothetical protein
MKYLITNPIMQRCVCVWIFILCVGPAALAQAGRGSISGVVTDPTGAVIPGVNVTLLNHANGVEQHSVTNAGGSYAFVSLNPGVYRVTASQTSFESVAQDNVNVTVDQMSSVNIRLRVGSVANTVTVSGGTDLMETSNSTVGQLISSETIDRVPMLTRNVYELIQLSGGVTPLNGSANSSQSNIVQSIPNGDPGLDVSSYTINGSVQGTVYYMFDGSPIGTAAGASVAPALHVPEDVISEFRMETQDTPASFQSGGAGVISLVSKSGGDQFHGDAFVVIRPDILAANEYFNKQSQLSQGQPNTPPSFHRYQEGGAIGGPILHKKLFFFGDYEATQQAQFDGSNVYTVPTAAEAQGDFSADTGMQIFDPVATNPDGSRHQIIGTNNGPGCGTPHLNCIPSSYLNPIALEFLSHFPPPTTTSYDPVGNPQRLNNFYAPGVDPFTAQKFDIRMDYYKSEKQHIFGRFSATHEYLAGVNAFNNAWDGYYAQAVNNGHNVLLADDYTINPLTVLQLRYSFTRFYANAGAILAKARWTTSPRWDLSLPPPLTRCTRPFLT